MIKCPHCGFKEDVCCFPDLFYSGCGYPQQEKILIEMQKCLSASVVAAGIFFA